MDSEEESVNLDAEGSTDDWTDADSNRDAIHQNDMDEEEQQYDITLTASHSYMGSGLHEMGGRVVLEAGWRGSVPVLGHHAVVFPGELVPLLLTDDHDAHLLAQAMHKDKLFGLLCPDETGDYVSGYGVLCEVYEAALRGAGAGGGAGGVEACKARALHRFVVTDRRLHALPLSLFSRARLADVMVLGEIPPAHPLRHARLAALDGRRGLASPTASRAVKRLEAAVTAWPSFVHELLDYRRLRDCFRAHFATVQLERLMPADPVQLSFWVSSNVPVASRVRVSLLRSSCALARLHLAARALARGAARPELCCAGCGAGVARPDRLLATSPAGAHATYTNPAGVVHDVITVDRAPGAALRGAAHADYCWFPGYTWTVAACRACGDHVGWRYDAIRSNLRPARFYGLCRNSVQPREPAMPDT